MKKLINHISLRLFGAILFKNESKLGPCGHKTVVNCPENVSFNEVFAHINHQLNRI
jgi:hypothetical protein